MGRSLNQEVGKEEESIEYPYLFTIVRNGLFGKSFCFHVLRLPYFLFGRKYLTIYFSSVASLIHHGYLSESKIFISFMHFDHHLKAYIFFLIVSIATISVLVYLYFPGPGGLRSDALDASGEVVPYEEVISMSSEVSSEAISTRRMRLTRLLLRYQLQLQKLESSQIADIGNTQTREAINQLRNKIDKLQSMIAKTVQ